MYLSLLTFLSASHSDTFLCVGYWSPYDQRTHCGPHRYFPGVARYSVSHWPWEARVATKVFVLNFGVKWFEFKHNFCFCEGNRFSKLNNYRQVVIGEEQLEVLGVNVIEEVSDFLIHHVAEASCY